jgi:hypothetical protein
MCVRWFPQWTAVVTVDGEIAPSTSASELRVRACHARGSSVVRPWSSAPFQLFAPPIGLVIWGRSMSQSVSLVEAGISTQAYASTRGPYVHEMGSQTARA